MSKSLDDRIRATLRTSCHRPECKMRHRAKFIDSMKDIRSLIADTMAEIAPKQEWDHATKDYELGWNDALDALLANKTKLLETTTSNNGIEGE